MVRRIKVDPLACLDIDDETSQGNTYMKSCRTDGKLTARFAMLLLSDTPELGQILIVEPLVYCSVHFGSGKSDVQYGGRRIQAA